MDSRHHSLIKISFLLLTAVGVILLFKVGIECFIAISDFKSASRLLSETTQTKPVYQKPALFQTIAFNVGDSDDKDDFDDMMKDMDRNMGHMMKNMDRNMGHMKNFVGHWPDKISGEITRKLWFYGFVLVIGALAAGACGVFSFFRSPKIGGIGLLALGLTFLIWWIDVQPGIAGILLLLGGLGFLVFDVLFPSPRSSTQLTQVIT